jgi:hypothetical protein
MLCEGEPGPVDLDGEVRVVAVGELVPVQAWFELFDGRHGQPAAEHARDGADPVHGGLLVVAPAVGAASGTEQTVLLVVAQRTPTDPGPLG